jgi:hypothetical protein
VEAYATFADDLEALLAGRMGEEMVRERYRTKETPEDIEAIMGWVEHFLADADIREKDSAYRRMQEQEMVKLIRCLRTGRIDEAKTITFLRCTDDVDERLKWAGH